MLEPAVRSTEAPSWYVVVVSPAVPGGYTVSDISDFTELSNVVSSRTATVIKTYHGNILAITKKGFPKWQAEFYQKLSNILAIGT